MKSTFQKQYDDAEVVDRADPLPLRRAIAAAGPYPLSALGKLLEQAARAIMDKIGCPDAIAAQSVLGAAALAAQAHADVIHPATGEAKPISLFLVTVAASGERKSAADHVALGPVKLRESELYEKFQREQRSYVDASAVNDKLREQALRSKEQNATDLERKLSALPRPRPPLTPLLTIPEPTLEGLHKLFMTGEPSLGLFSDEGGSFIGGHSMSEEIRLRTAAGLSGLWDGTPIKRVRGGDGVTYLKGRRCSLHLMVQPGIADGLLADRTLREQGLLSRLLVAAPASLAGTRMQQPVKPTTEPALKRYQTRMLQLLRHEQRRASQFDPALQPRGMTLTKDARQLWSQFADECERELVEGGRFESIRGFANKLPEHALRIAAVLELFGATDAEYVSADGMKRGVEVARYYSAEALRLFEQGSSSVEILRAELVLRWLHERWRKPEVGLAHIYQFGPNSIRDASRAREAALILEQHNWLRRIELGATIDGKRHRDAWEIVPSAFLTRG